MKRTRLKPISDKQRARKLLQSGQEELAHAWWLAVVKGKSCILCGKPSRVQGHHVIAAQVLKRLARDRGLDAAALLALLWDVRNGIPVCEREHADHSTAKKRIPRSALPLVALQFAAELDLTWMIERDYPAQDVS